MTSQQSGKHSRGDGEWQAVFGDVNDPTDPRFAAEYQPPRRPPRRWARSLRRAVVAIVILAVVGGGVFAFVSRGNKKSPDAGSSVSAPITPSTSAGSSSAAVLTAAQKQDIKLVQALTVAASWGQLDPFLKNLASAGVPSTCLNVTSSNESKCRFGAKSAKHHAVLVGDSAALDWLPAIVTELAPHGWDVQVLTYSNCPISRVAITINGASYDACSEHHAFVADQISTLKPSLIFASDEDVDLTYATAPPKPKGGTREKASTAFTSGVTQAVEEFASAGKVVVIGSPPGSKAIPSCQADLPAPKSCAAPVRTGWEIYQNLLKGAIKGHASYLDPTDAFCHDKRCPGIVGVTPVYTNGVRMTDAFSKTLAYLFAPYVNG